MVRSGQTCINQHLYKYTECIYTFHYLQLVSRFPLSNLLHDNALASILQVVSRLKSVQRFDYLQKFFTLNSVMSFHNKLMKIGTWNSNGVFSVKTQECPIG